MGHAAVLEVVFWPSYELPAVVVSPHIINAAAIIDLRMRHPFQPIRLRLTSGESIIVDHPWKIATAPNAPSCAAYDESGDLRLVRYRDVAELDTVLPG